MIGLCFALPSESSNFHRLWQKRPDLQESVALCHTGVGRAVAAPRIAAFLDANRVSCLLSSGFAGALRSQLRPGQLFLAENFSEPALARAALSALAQLQPATGRMHTAEGVIASAAERQELCESSGADAVDMETSAIAEACAFRDIPLLSLRAVSDSVDQPFPCPPEVLFSLATQRTEPTALFRYLLLHPGGMIPLLRFGTQIARVRESLTAALLLLLESGVLPR